MNSPHVIQEKSKPQNSSSKLDRIRKQTKRDYCERMPKYHKDKYIVIQMISKITSLYKIEILLPENSSSMSFPISDTWIELRE